MTSLFCGLIYLILSFLKLYVFGFFALIRQVLQKHKTPSELHQVFFEKVLEFPLIATLDLCVLVC